MKELPKEDSSDNGIDPVKAQYLPIIDKHFPYIGRYICMEWTLAQYWPLNNRISRVSR